MSTGFAPEIKAAIILRDGGKCLLCGARATEANHRLNRKAGGRKGGNGMSNGSALCHDCNSGIESNAILRAEALELGIKLEEHQDPATTPMYISFYSQWCQPGDDALELLGLRLHDFSLTIDSESST